MVVNRHFNHKFRIFLHQRENFDTFTACGACDKYQVCNSPGQLPEMLCTKISQSKKSAVKRSTRITNFEQKSYIQLFGSHFEHKEVVNLILKISNPRENVQGE